jgi:hypothetical protein
LASQKCHSWDWGGAWIAGRARNDRREAQEKVMPGAVARALGILIACAV